MQRHNGHTPAATCLALVATAICFAALPDPRIAAQSEGPEVLVPNLSVRSVVDGLTTPIALAFLADDDFLVL